MEITEDQRKRAEANRLAAIEKRKRAAEVRGDVWTLFKCRKIRSLPLPETNKPPNLLSGGCFRAVLEICSPDEFSVVPQPLQDFPFPGEDGCFRMIESCLVHIPLRCVQSQIGKKAVFKLDDYEMVLGHLKKFQGMQLQGIPYKTRVVVEKFSVNGDHCWLPFLPNHLPDDEVDRLIAGLPKLVQEALLPFQLEGVRFGLRRGGKCLIADEMGLGKTLQAIAIASCFMDEGSVLVVCPAVLRYSWAEELERWLPLLPTDIHLIFGHQDNLDHLQKTPKVVVISFKMLHRLQISIARRAWALMIVDESHKMHCTKKTKEAGETEAVLDVAGKTDRIILLSGTPSLTRPFDIFHQINILWSGLLGTNKYEYATNYCSPQVVRGPNGTIYKDFSRGIRLEELNILLTRAVMMRRLKEHVLAELPPKRRQIIRLKLKESDVRLALVASGKDVACVDDQCEGKTGGRSSFENDILEKVNISNEFAKGNKQRTLKELSFQELGIAKLSGFREWFSDHKFVNIFEDADSDVLGPHKMIIFSHHIKVLDGIQEFLCEKSIKFVRIDGSTSARDRQVAVETFRTSKEVKIVIIGITAGGVGLDFSSAKSVVFLELPKSASEMLQAEDRAHRRGQTNAVNIYIFCAKDTLDESHWLQLNRSLYRVSSMMNGKVNAVKEIEVDNVSYLDDFHKSLQYHYREVITDTVTSLSPDKSGSMDNLCDKYDHKDGDQGNMNSSSLAELDFYKFHSEKQSNSSYDNLDGNFSRNKDRNIISTFDWNANDENGANQCTQSENRNCFPPERITDGMISEDEEHMPIQPDSLRFEVSQFTGRIHLYVCSLQTDSRPKPLFENFRPEDLESMAFALNSHNKTLPYKSLKQNPAFWNIFQTFVNEWNNLRPIERNKLFGRPLQLPLHLELCYLKESINHEGGGLLKGGSKRRVTPWREIYSKLPPDAAWKKISLRCGSTKETVCIQAWSLADEPLCKLCQSPCVGKLAKTPQYFEDLFCNLDCLQEYRIRTSGRFLRDALFQLEHGVCTKCKLDCHKLIQQIRPLSIERRRALVKDIAPGIASNENMLEKIVNEPTEGNAWHADHIVPVYKGGGECRLENMRTLCVACHSEVTRAQQADRHLTRMRAKEQLKIVMKDLKDQMKIGGDVKEGGQENEDHAEEDGLLIQVPGSSYSRKANGAD